MIGSYVEVIENVRRLLQRDLIDRPLAQTAILIMLYTKWYAYFDTDTCTYAKFRFYANESETSKTFVDLLIEKDSRIVLKCKANVEYFTIDMDCRLIAERVIYNLYQCTKDEYAFIRWIEIIKDIVGESNSINVLKFIGNFIETSVNYVPSLVFREGKRVEIFYIGASTTLKIVYTMGDSYLLLKVKDTNFNTYIYSEHFEVTDEQKCSNEFYEKFSSLVDKYL